jgi:hypothetical protein
VESSEAASFYRVSVQAPLAAAPLAAFAQGPLVTVSGSTFVECSSRLWGGAFILAGGAFQVRDVRISSCRAQRGGGMSVVLGATADFTNITISDCIADEDGGGVYASSA